ncbi:uncharacterized protein EV420DRAFT_562063 [Desarmillaria tabescens]|uniref:SH3 domain-containing protein n=1 Tax=Armillaria tabescens TaxID=1929756 RepID=A0AA39J0X1_ARMTA|nr:uncharacterized protein EV420DRAFT_562063 [Desarmillaria tabescens]KAK0433227.1 hypothetical protein EV420DRAFT_562063 [Desarmillaria tabescens]
MNPTCPSAPIPPPPSVVQAKAVLPYNLAPSDPGYLSFAVDDIITIVEETDAVWWLGECNGCRGCFPAKYVEKITMASAHSGADVHPPPGVRTTDSSGLQQDPDQEGKKSKLGKFCITVCSLSFVHDVF